MARISTAIFLPVRLVQQVRTIRAARRASLESRDPKHAVFVCDRVHVRAIKMADTLRAVGWNVTLLHGDNLSDEVTGYFSSTRRFAHSFDALRLAANYRPVVYHVFSNYNFDVASTFIRYKPGKVLFDNYDVLTGIVKENILRRYEGQIELEQYCYLNADGLCCRDLRVQHPKRTLGTRLPPRLLFPEYCWPENKFRKTPRLTDGIHVAYVGSIEPDPDSTSSFIYELAVTLSRNRVHLHLYPSMRHLLPRITATMARFVAGDDSRYVHIHDTISPVAVREEISRYHYGLLISTNHVGYGSDHDTYFAHMGDHLVPSKVFDYLDAGLFVLVQHDARFTRFILRRNGEPVDSLEDIALKCSVPPGDVTVPRSLRLEANVDRLTTFYSRLNA